MEQITYKNNLRKLRLERNLTQQDVAHLLGHKYQDRISKWEKGHKVPNLQNLTRLCQIFNASLEDLYAPRDR